MNPNNTKAQLENLLAKRILILDGAMGTMIQQYDLDEAGFKGEIFKSHPIPLKGNNDILSLTQPQIIEEIHTKYLEAGADIIETNTFNANAISLADYKLESKAYKLNLSSAKIARAAVEKFRGSDGLRPFVAGSFGPTNRAASMSPDINDSSKRMVTFDHLVDAYTEQISGLIEGGVDILLVETVFDPLNCKAALFAINSYF